MRISDWSSDVCSSDLGSSPAPSLACDRRLLGALLLQVLAGLLVDDLHGQLHLAAVVEAEDLDLHGIALLDHLADALRPAVGGELADVHQPVLGTEEVHEGAELEDLDDLAVVDLADLRLRDVRADPVVGGIERALPDRSEE